MKLNCKPGDLAVIVRTSPGLEQAIGHIVTVVRPERRDSPALGWIIDPPQKINGAIYDACADWCLRPIRDNDGEDETLQWL